MIQLVILLQEVFMIHAWDLKISLKSARHVNNVFPRVQVILVIFSCAHHCTIHYYFNNLYACFHVAAQGVVVSDFLKVHALHLQNASAKHVLLKRMNARLQGRLNKLSMMHYA